MTGGRRWLGWAVLAYAVIIAAVGLGLGRLYAGSHSRLDEALGQRLLAVAGSLAEMTDGRAILSVTLGDTADDYYLETLREKYLTIASQHHLSEITLTNPVDGLVILSTSESQVTGQPNDYWGLDPAAVALATSGTAAATELYEVGGVEKLKQKTAYAPITNYTVDGGYVVAVVTVSGSPGFFGTLADLKHGAYLTAFLVLAILVVMGVFLSRLSLALAESRASLLRRENLVAMGRMTAGIAHEIRNPLGIIRGAGEHLKQLLSDHGITDPLADYIPEEVDRLDHILAGYLAFGTDNQTAPEVFNLGAVVDRTLQLVAVEFAETGVVARLITPPAAAPVLGDRRRWQQVVLNLLINARDAMPGGGHIDVAVRVAKGRVTVEIRDEGCGLAGVDTSRIFEPFWTTREKGSGLGLAMSRQIVEDMGGRLTLRDRESARGAVAVVWVPVTDREGDPGGPDSIG